jgi:hypothetical protein
MATIFRKTAKGQAEIETRAARLPPRLRGALILVDGRRSDDEMRRLIPVEPEATLQTLAAQGFIEAISITADLPLRPAPAAPATAAQAPVAPRPPAGIGTAAPAAGPGPGQGMSPRDFQTLRADLIRSFTDMVGPMAEALAIKMERSRSPDELKPLLDVAQRIVANARGQQAAASFGAKVSGSLGR